MGTVPDSPPGMAATLASKKQQMDLGSVLYQDDTQVEDQALDLEEQQLGELMVRF